MRWTIGIQIPIYIHSIAEQYAKVKRGAFEIPSFKDRCPLCGRKDCASFLGYYTRHAVDSATGIHFIDFPIHRYECTDPLGFRGETAHRTFSLLPVQLIPYERFDITLIVTIAEHRLQGESYDTICDLMANMLVKEPLLITPRKIRDAVALVDRAFSRMGSVPDFLDMIQQCVHGDLRETILKFIELGNQQVSVVFPRLSGMVSLAFEYFRACLPRICFLFGIPSQMRFA